MTPASGPGGGGTSVQIAGSGLSGATSVMFGSVAATTFKANASGTWLKVTAPTQAAGTVNIVVTTPGGVSTISQC